MSDPVTETFLLVRCVKCAQPFYMTRVFHDIRVRDQREFYCPAGHSQFFLKPEDQKANEQLRAEIQELQQEIITLRKIREDVTAFEPKTWREKLGINKS